MGAGVWDFDANGKVDRVHSLSGDQHQMDAFVWANYTLAPIPERIAWPPCAKTPKGPTALRWGPSA